MVQVQHRWTLSGSGHELEGRCCAWQDPSPGHWRSQALPADFLAQAAITCILSIYMGNSAANAPSVNTPESNGLREDARKYLIQSRAYRGAGKARLLHPNVCKHCRKLLEQCVPWALGWVPIVIAIPAAQLIELHSLIGSMTCKEQVVAWVDLPCKALRSMNVINKHQSHACTGPHPQQLQWTVVARLV